VGIFKELFKPVWMSENGKKTKKALHLIKHEQSIEKLVKIIEKAPLENIRMAATDKLLRMIKKVTYRRYDTYSNYSREADEEAIKKISNQNILADIAKCDPAHLRSNEHAVELIKDPDILADIAINAESEYIRLEATNKLFAISPSLAQDSYIAIAKNDKSWERRIYAAKKLNDQTFLNEICTYVLTNMITEESIISKLPIFASNHDELLKEYIEVIEMLSDQSAFEKVANNAKICFIQKAAVYKISDPQKREKLLEFLSDNMQHSWEYVGYQQESTFDDTIGEKTPVVKCRFCGEYKLEGYGYVFTR